MRVRGTSTRAGGTAVARGIVVSLLAGGALLAVAGCNHLADIGCEKKTCHYDVSSGGKVEIGGHELAVQKVGHNSVTLLSNGVSVSLVQGLDVDFLGYHLRLGQIDGGAANLEVTKN